MSVNKCDHWGNSTHIRHFLTTAPFEEAKRRKISPFRRKRKGWAFPDGCREKPIP